MTSSVVQKASRPDGAADRRALWQARYGEASVPVLPSEWNDTLEVLLDHRTSRNYRPDALPAGTVELLVAAAQSAPTSSNLQAWSVIAVEDPERKARLAGLTGGNAHILAAPLLLVWLVDLSRLRGIARQHGNNGEALDFHESFLIGAIDAALAAQNAVVAIDSLGLGSCYIGGMRNQLEAVANELKLPPETVAVFGLTVGYPDLSVDTDVKPRLPQSAVLFREQYGEVRHEDLAAYDEAMTAFQRKQKLPLTGWTSVIAKRIESEAVLKGRSRLTAILRHLGFPLK